MKIDCDRFARVSVPRLLGGALLLTALAAPRASQACACGCGVFDVGTSSMFPTSSGWMAFLEYDYQDQTHNWSGTSSAPGADNTDKEIRTHFVTAGLQYMIDRSWGVEVDIPYVNRTFRTDIGAPGSPDVVSRNWDGVGDIRIKGLYTGFSADLSTGISLGVKVPSGTYTFASDVVDRDTQFGSGSTDVLVGAYHRHRLTPDNSWSWFAQGQLDAPVLNQDGYRPGPELDAAAGVHYNNWTIGGTQITPLAQVIGSYRLHDGGGAGDPENSGYERVLLSPALEIDLHPVRIYVDAEFPVFQRVTGNQVTAPVLFKAVVSYMF
jgi:hypothetical protein